MDVEQILDEREERQWKEYSLDEVSYHSEADSCWIVVLDFVYDITQYLFEVITER